MIQLAVKTKPNIFFNFPLIRETMEIILDNKYILLHCLQLENVSKISIIIDLLTLIHHSFTFKNEV